MTLLRARTDNGPNHKTNDCPNNNVDSLYYGRLPSHRLRHGTRNRCRDSPDKYDVRCMCTMSTPPPPKQPCVVLDVTLLYQTYYIMTSDNVRVRLNVFCNASFRDVDVSRSSPIKYLRPARDGAYTVSVCIYIYIITSNRTNHVVNSGKSVEWRFLVETAQMQIVPLAVCHLSLINMYDSEPSALLEIAVI